MGDTLPPDFDPEAYAAAYPDVALSGLGAREHFLRFGRLFGRSASGKPPEGKANVPSAPVTARESAVDSALLAAEGLPPAVPIVVQAGPARPPASEAIVARPEDFRAEEVVPLPAVAKTPRGTAETLGFDAFIPSSGGGSSADPIRAYARMVGMTDPVGTEALGALRPRDERFETGDCRIENAWFADPSTLRLMIAHGLNDGGNLAGWAMRGFQAHPEAPAELRAAGTGIQLPERGPCFVDIALAHPLMPVLLELADPDGATRALALLPFPSLLAGGLHWGEAKALQAAANPIDSFWSLSERFLRELIDGAQAPARSIVEVLAETGTGGDSMLSKDVRDWLDVVFGLGSGRPAPKSSGLRLVLPQDAVPTIAALVSRRLDGCVGCAGPFIVAEVDNRRPLGSVAPSPRFEPGPSAPRLESPGRARRRAAASLAPVHLAIVYRRPRSSGPNSTDCLERSPLPPLTILLDASDAGRTEALVRQLKDGLDADRFDLWVRMDGGAELRATLDRLCGAGHWRPVDRAGLHQVAHGARHDLLLTIDDRVRLGDDTLLRLLAILDGGEDIASASCLLVGETIVKKQIVLRPGSGGLFPSGVSFLGGPSMAFAEPDVSDLLRDTTYPVVANTLALTVWRRSPLLGLPDPAGPVPRSGEDIAIGLGLTRSGHRNLCTTIFSASITGDHVRRDAIDPLGTAIVQPWQWQDLLDRVTIVRELY